MQFIGREKKTLPSAASKAVHSLEQRKNNLALEFEENLSSDPVNNGLWQTFEQDF